MSTRGTSIGADGDHIDVFVGPDPACELVFVVDQQNPATRSFNEHKVLLGFRSESEAREAYLANYPEGWKGLRAVTAMTIGQFKAWLRDGDLSQPAAGATVKMAAAKWAQRFAKLSSLECLDDDPAAASADLQEKVSEDAHSRGDSTAPTTRREDSLTVRLAKNGKFYWEDADEGRSGNRSASKQLS